MEHLLGPDSKLTAKASERIRQHVSGRKIMGCCVNPRFVPIAEVFTCPLVNRVGDATGIDYEHGVPLVSVVCESCGQVKIFLMHMVFPEWRPTHPGESRDE